MAPKKKSSSKDLPKKVSAASAKQVKGGALSKLLHKTR